jgi:hypothetical protein
MKLDLSPEQFLALYDALSYQLNSTDSDTLGWNNVNDIKVKMEDSILESLRSTNIVQNQSKFSVWAEKEQRKIEELQDDLENVQSIDHTDDGLIPDRPTRLKNSKRVA